MKIYICLIIAALTFITSACHQSGQLDRLQDEAAKVSDQPAKWASKLPTLTNAGDSASYLMGYIYGAQLNMMVSDGRLPELTDINNHDFEQGIAMALTADSTSLSMLYGIMLGLELRGSMTSITKEIDMKWNIPMTYKGFYQGVNRSIPQAVPVPVVEEQLNRLLRPYFISDESEEGDF